MTDITNAHCDQYPECGLSQYSCNLLQDIVYEKDTGKRRDMAVELRKTEAEARQAMATALIASQPKVKHGTICGSKGGINDICTCQFSQYNQAIADYEKWIKDYFGIKE